MNLINDERSRCEEVRNFNAELIRDVKGRDEVECTPPKPRKSLDGFRGGTEESSTSSHRRSCERNRRRRDVKNELVGTRPLRC